MAKPNAAKNTPAPAPSANPDTKKASSGRTYKSRRAKLNLDGFLFVGKKEDPLFGSIEGRITHVVKREEGSFIVLEVDNVEGSLLLANKEEDGTQGEPFAPDAWPGLRVGLSGYASFSDIFDDPSGNVGKQVLIEYGGMSMSKNKRSFREINVYDVAEPANGKAPQATA